jgi:hypothetical protein
MGHDPLERFRPSDLKSFPEWRSAIARTLAADEMLPWFTEVLEAHARSGEFQPFHLNLYCAALCRFQDLAHFSRKLTPDQREVFKDQAATILELVNVFWGEDGVAMHRLDAALAESAERYKRYGWPSAEWDAVEFEEI